jgi:hypothetical protein
MKMMFNGSDRPFELSNSKYEREAREILYFTKHHSLTLYIYIAPLFCILSNFAFIYCIAKMHICIILINVNCQVNQVT